MAKAEDVIRDWIKLIKLKPDKYIILFDALKNYADNNDYFNTQFDGSLELVFNTNLKTSNAYSFINILINYNILIGKKNDKKIYISQYLNSLDNLEEFLFIIDNDISLKEYSRYKKLKKLKNDIKY